MREMDQDIPFQWLVFEAETNNLNWSPGEKAMPRLIRLSWVLADVSGNMQTPQTCLIHPEGFRIARSIQLFMGIDEVQWKQEGVPLAFALDKFASDLVQVTALLCQQPSLEWTVLESELGAQALVPGEAKAVWSPRQLVTAAMPQYGGSQLSQDFFRFLYGRNPERNHLPMSRVSNLAALLPALAFSRESRKG